MLVKIYQLKLNYIDIVEEHYYETESEATEVLKDLLLYYNQYASIEMIEIVKNADNISRKVLYTIINKR